jgi:inner membrane protein
VDTLTHTFLGAAVGHLVAGRRLGRWGLLLGAVAGNLPDADIFIRLSDPLLTHELHRHFTHSLVMVPVLAALAAAPFLLSRHFRPHWRLVLGTALAACATHTVLDACTSFGTLMLWPFSRARISWDFVSVSDPLVTLPLVIAFIFALRPRSGPRTTARITAVALLWVVGYLGLGAWQHHRAAEAQRELAASRGHTVVAARVMPTFGNILLWRSIYQHDHRLQCDALRLLHGAAPRVRVGSDVALVTAGDLAAAGASAADLDAFARFAWFADGYIAYAPARPDVLADMRYSLRTDGFDPVWGIKLSGTPGLPAWVDLATGTPRRSVQTAWRDLFTGQGYVALGAAGGR